MINPMELTGKHILITGGSSGIGRACAIQASKLGAKVTVIARNEEKLKETLAMTDNPDNNAYYCADLSEIDKIEDLVKKIIAERGPVDGFCHAAGVGTARVLKISKINYVDKMFKIHAFAFFEFCRVLSLKKNLNHGASIVGVSSVAAVAGNIGQDIYAAAKGAINSFLKPAAKELAMRKIRVNNVAYAMVDTDMYQEFLESGGDENAMRLQYLGVIDVETAANAVVFLLSDASKFTTGTVLPVYAGC